MTPYLDFTFLIRLVVLVDGSGEARDVSRQFIPPFCINDLHILQVENFLRQVVERDIRSRQLMTAAELLWKNQMDELVFESESVDWTKACVGARELNRLAKGWAGTPLALLHLSAAQQVGATHLLSFDPRQRRLGAETGLIVLPDLSL